MTVTAATTRVSELDRLTPSFQFNEVHATRIRATSQQVYRAIKDVTAGEIFLFRTLTWLRRSCAAVLRSGRPSTESILNAPERRPLLDVALHSTFLMLADSPREIVVGTVVIAPPDGHSPANAGPDNVEDFVELATREGYALATMNFVVTPRPDGGCELSTETRVYATDERTRRRFAWYWRFIHLGSALIRVMWLRAIKRRAEARSA